MDPFGAFKSEVFRPIASIALPGLLALAPFMIILCNDSLTVKNYFEAKPVAAYLMLVGAAVILGMLLENIGASIERGIDECMEKEYLSGAGEIWDRYLSESGNDTNARRFLGTLVTRLKFINSLIPALVLFSAGMFWLHLQVHALQTWQVVAFGMLCLTILVWLFRMSIELSEAALFSRHRLLCGVGRGCYRYDPDAKTVGRHRHLAYVLTEVLTARVEQLEIVGRPWYVAFLWIARVSWIWAASVIAMGLFVWCFT